MKLFLCFFTLLSLSSYGQSHISVSAQNIWGSTKVKDNWTPSTAPAYKELSGSYLGKGVNIAYVFHPKLLIRDTNFSVNIGMGFFNQRFDMRRPFNYNTTLLIVIHSHDYIYKSWQGLLGLSYKYRLKKYFVSGSALYNIFQSYEQEYIPDASNTSVFPKEVHNTNIDFGKMLTLNVGLNRYLGDKFSLGLSIITPVYTRWRNDEIFDDNPETFFRPESSLGFSINAAYHLKKKHK